MKRAYGDCCRQILRITNLLIVTFLMFANLAACGGGGGGGSDDGGTTPPPPTLRFFPSNPIADNPTSTQVILGRDFPMHSGFSPPTLNGEYAVTGTIVDSNITDAIGLHLDSTIILSNQTEFGGIDYEEIIRGLPVDGAGHYYIAGDNDAFTISAKANMTVGSCNVENALFFSGQRLTNGNLEVETLSVNLARTNCGGYTVADWHEVTGTLTRQNSDPLAISLSPTDVTFISSVSPNSNYSSDLQFVTGNLLINTLSVMYGLLKFDVSEVPSGATIDSANLVLRSSISFEETGETSVYRIYEDWQQDTVTYSNRPDRSYIPLDPQSVNFAAVQEYSWDITLLVRNWYHGGMDNYGVLVDSTLFSGTGTDRGLFNKSSIRLDIEYTPWV